jgi:hypothetical protein
MVLVSGERYRINLEQALPNKHKTETTIIYFL